MSSWPDQKIRKPLFTSEDIVKVLNDEIEGVMQIGAIQTIIPQQKSLFNGALLALTK